VCTGSIFTAYTCREQREKRRGLSELRAKALGPYEVERCVRDLKAKPA
jgi:hypothetical protein